MAENPRGQRKLVLLDTFAIKKPQPDGDTAVETVDVISRMFEDQIATLNFGDKVVSPDRGKEKTAANGNGTYKYSVRGCEGQQAITVFLNTKTEAEADETVIFRVPYYYPNYRLIQLLKGIGTVIGFKRNGIRYPLTAD